MTDTAHLLGANRSLMSVLSTKEASGRHEVAAIFLNSGLLHRVGPYRLYVLLARRLAEAGIPVLRIDQSGKGDSARRPGVPFEQSVNEDFEEAAAFLRRETGARKFIVLGLCSGADDGLYLSARYPEIAGAVLLEPVAIPTPRYFVRHYGQRLLRPDIWAAWAGRMVRALLAPLARLARHRGRRNRSIDNPLREFAGLAETRNRYQSVLQRQGKLLCVFTSAARRYYNYQGQLAEWLRLAPAQQLLTEVYLPAAKHTYPLAAHREQLMAAVCEWIGREFGAGPAPAVSAVENVSDVPA